MRRSSRILSAAALAGALALIAGPALANGSGSSVAMPPWQWYIAAGGGEWGVDETSYDDGNGSRFDAWSQSSMSFTRPNPTIVTTNPSSIEAAGAAPSARFECVSVTTTTSGLDRVVTCDDTVTTAWGLSITSEVRVLAPGDLARVTYFVTNTGIAPTKLGYSYAWGYGTSVGHVQSSEPAVTQDTSSGAGVLETADVWSYNLGDRTLNAGVAWGIEGSPFVGTLPFHRGFTEASVFLTLDAAPTLAAGETTALVFFHKVQEPEAVLPESAPDAASADAEVVASESGTTVTPPLVPAPASSHEAVTPASVMAEFATFDGRLTRGLPSDISIGNWQPAATPELADTGAGGDETLVMGGIPAALLGAGAALVITRRGARANRR